ncbi:MAG: hypothetical protein WCJ63_08045 [Actinomycetes bacterium]
MALVPCILIAVLAFSGCTSAKDTEISQQLQELQDAAGSMETATQRLSSEDWKTVVPQIKQDQKAASSAAIVLESSLLDAGSSYTSASTLATIVKEDVYQIDQALELYGSADDWSSATTRLIRSVQTLSSDMEPLEMEIRSSQ